MRTTPIALQEIIYVSTLAADVPIRVVADIAMKARCHNKDADITGLLIFDGQYFCQQLEGVAAKVAEVMARIRLDLRHHDVSIVYQGALEKRRFCRFSLGYTSAEDIELLERLRQLQGQAAVNAFMDLLAGLDMDE